MVNEKALSKSEHLLAGFPVKHLQVSALQTKINQFAKLATEGINAKTHGMMKIAEAELRKALDDFRAKSKLGVYHKEWIAVLSVDIRGSSKLAKDHSADN